MQVFSTENLRGSERIAYWNEVICDYALDVNTSIEMPAGCTPRFTGKLTRNDIGNLSLIDIVSEGPLCTVSRDLRRTCHAEDEFAMLNVQVSGSSIINQAGRSACLKPGNMVLYDSRLPHNGRVDCDTRNLLLRIPRGDIIHRIPYLREVTTVVLDPYKTMTRLAYDMLLSLNSQLPAGDADGNEAVANTILDTVTAAVSGSFRSSDAGFPSSSSALLHRVKSFIDYNLLQPDLDPKRIASAHHVSVRYLNRLFAREHTSITRWICKRRLQKCTELLSCTRDINRNIDDIAYLCGFSSLPYFYRRFKQHYGCTPREYKLRISNPGRV